MQKAKNSRSDKDTKQRNDLYWIEYGIDIDNRRIMLDDDVDDTVIGWIIRALEVMKNKDPDKEILIIVNSYGGEVYSGLALYDFICDLPMNIRTYATGKVMSMGLTIYLAGDTREASKSATFLAHSISSGVRGKLFELVTETKECTRLENYMLDIYEDKTGYNGWRKLTKHEDFIFNKIQAKKLGVVNSD